MRRFRLTSLVGSTLLLLSLSASAQYYPNRNNPDRDSPGTYDRRLAEQDFRGSSNRGLVPENVLFTQTVADLNRAVSPGDFRGGDRRRIGHASREVWDFQNRWRAGSFDRGELDEAINSLQQVVNMRYLDNRDHDTLQNDFDRLREFRAAQSARDGYYRPY